MIQYKKFISPGAWFSMLYPATWNEFEENEGAFLFYNPNEWTGNFRISAYRGEKDKKGNLPYGESVVKEVLKDNPTAQSIKLNNRSCAYSKEMFMENEEYFTTHWWVIGEGDMVFDCSFTVHKGASVAEAEGVIASIETRSSEKKYPAEIIPIRLSEIFLINESYDWVASMVKEHYKKDFQGTEDDLNKLQQIIDDKLIAAKKKEEWLALGIAICVVIANEIDNVQWMTLIDGNREAPILQFSDGRIVDPMKLVWSKIKASEACDIIATYQAALNG